KVSSPSCARTVTAVPSGSSVSSSTRPPTTLPDAICIPVFYQPDRRSAVLPEVGNREASRSNGRVGSGLEFSARSLVAHGALFFWCARVGRCDRSWSPKEAALFLTFDGDVAARRTRDKEETRALLAHWAETLHPPAR